ncbi:MULTISPECIES: hypothetical protein [unclassified Nocardiopsis]|uniref:hypothetical protein n=1 Tax=unclassified Nocardiopsis TaxID=2649073 RepID=UPI00135B3E43|nr:MULTISPECIES: hypothetical protein [unclassified Nocardiopsis]
MLLALAVGCAASSAPAGTASGADPSAEPSAFAPQSEEEAVLTAYTGMWDAVVAASHEGAASSDDLERHAVGAALVLMNTALEQARTQGVLATGEPVLAPEAHIEDSDRATVTDCLDDSGWSLGVGAPGQAGTRRVEATLTHDGLAWRVSDLRIWETGSC